MTAIRPPVIYPARRALEHAVSLPGVSPKRYFGVLWPFWRVEITGEVDDAQAYEVIDRFIERAIAEARLVDASAIAQFLSLPLPLVEGCLRYLVMIDHVQWQGGVVTLTPRGYTSLRDGKRYVAKEARQLLLFDQFTARPMPRGHYAGSVTLLDEPRVNQAENPDGTRFVALFAGTEYRDLVEPLANNPDRASYNLPHEVRKVRVLGVSTAYLPAYLVETTAGLFAYTRAGEERDLYLENICREGSGIGEQLSREPSIDPRTLWIDWAAERSAGLDSLRQLDNGVWRCTLPATSYGEKVPLRRLGSFEVRRQYFLQLWCDDPGVRRRAVLERGARMAGARGVGTRATLVARVSALASQLDVSPPDLDAIRAYAQRNNLPEAVARLDALR